MSEPLTVIAECPPEDGQRWDCQCARCGSSMDFERCDSCGGDGFTAPGDLYEEDPLWYDRDDVEPCQWCNGRGGWRRCSNSVEWCLAHPQEGRSLVLSGTVEWFARLAS